MALSGTSPLYRRDVDQLDRQDDNAATCTFCAGTLDWINQHHREWWALAVYLFIFGELTDAYQNCSIGIHEHVVMALRAHFFLEMWEHFLDINNYSKSRHFISSQCHQICNIVIHGFLKLVIIYRNHLDKPMPFFPWLYSTEVIEHIFGICRQFVKDFIAENFQQMVSKIHIQLRKAHLSAQVNTGRATASGYSHTYSDVRGVNATALAIKEISDAANQVFKEAELLFALLGASANDIFTREPTLPPVQTWWKDSDQIGECVRSVNKRDGSDSNDSDHEWDSDSECESEPDLDIVNMQDTIDQAASIIPAGLAEETTLNTLCYASAALSIEDDQIM